MTSFYDWTNSNSEVQDEYFTSRKHTQNIYTGQLATAVCPETCVLIDLGDHHGWDFTVLGGAPMLGVQKKPAGPVLSHDTNENILKGRLTEVNRFGREST